MRLVIVGDSGLCCGARNLRSTVIRLVLVPLFLTKKYVIDLQRAASLEGHVVVKQN